MATLSLSRPPIDAPLPHIGLIAGFALLACAVAAGYSLAVGELEALYVGLALSACVAIMIDYRVGAVLLILLLPVSSSSVFPHALMGVTGLNPINVLLAGTLAAYLLRGRVDNPAPLVPRPLLWLYIVPIVLAGLLGSLHVDDIHPAFMEQLLVDFTDWRGYLRDDLVKPMFIVLSAVLVAGAVAKARKPEPFIAAIAIGVCALAFLVFGFIIASQVKLGYLASPRARSFFLGIGTHANELGRMFVIGYALLLFTWWETKHAVAKPALFVALGILTLAILLTFSRNAFLGFLLVNALFLVWKFNAKKLALAVLGTAVAAALAPGAVYRRLTYGFDTGADAVSAGRIDGIWLPLLPETLKSPLWGSGLDSIMWSHAMRGGAMEFVGHPHNAYLQAVLDMGLIGLVLLILYYWHVWKGFRALGSNAYLTPVMRGFFQGACAALVGFGMAGLSGGSLRPEPENMLLWIAIGMMYGVLARRPAS
jgi:O-antigen ligase